MAVEWVTVRKCVAYLALPRRVGKSIGEEAPDGNERQDHNPGADREKEANIRARRLNASVRSKRGMQLIRFSQMV